MCPAPPGVPARFGEAPGDGGMADGFGSCVRRPCSFQAGDHLLRKEARSIMISKTKRWGALAAAAALLFLTACGDGPAGSSDDPQPGQSISAGPGEQEQSPQPSQPEHDPAAVTPDPLPSATDPAPETPVQTEDPTEPPASPSQTEFTPPPEPVTGRVAWNEPVEEEWFADAVFVGDSRTDGLQLYSGIKSATFFSHQGLSVFNVGTKECISYNGQQVTALDALSGQEFAKVYLMLGVNELGYPSSSFRTAFQEVVDQIKTIQPNASIYVQTILPVNEAMVVSHGMSNTITNARVREFNEIIAQIVEDAGVALLDVAEIFWDANGSMSSDNTSDGVHLTRQGYVAWFEYLKCHTGTGPVGTDLPDPEPGPSEGAPAEEPTVFEPEEGETGGEPAAEE